MGDTGKGMVAMAAAAAVWGLSSIYYKALTHVGALEVLAHRTWWSFVFLAALLAYQGRMPALRALLAGRGVWLVVAAALLISINWFTFIFSVQSGRALESSLGYYMFPLVAVLIGVVGFGEHLGRLRGTAVALAAISVGLLTYGLGVAPWLSLVLAVTFGLYGAVKKGLDAGPVVSVVGEVTLLAPVALGLILYRYGTGQGGAQDALDWGLLMFSGLLTGFPLVLMAYAARRISYGLLGLMQYINPTLQLIVAALVFGEVVSGWHGVALPLIWIGLALYSYAALRQDRASDSTT